MNTTQKLIGKIENFQPTEDGNWIQLDQYLDELWSKGNPSSLAYETLFRVFERYPDQDGAGIFWSIVHGLEHLGNYENELFNSLGRQPSDMGLIMLKRLENPGHETINGQPINQLYKKILDHPKTTDEVKSQVAGFIKSN